MSNRREFLVEGGKLALAGLAATAGLGLPDRTSKAAPAEWHSVLDATTNHGRSFDPAEFDLPAARLVFRAEISAGDSTQRFFLHFWGYQYDDHEMALRASCDGVRMNLVCTEKGPMFITPPCARPLPIVVQLHVDTSTFRSPIVTIDKIETFDLFRLYDPGERVQGYHIFPQKNKTRVVDLPVTSITLHEGHLAFNPSFDSDGSVYSSDPSLLPAGFTFTDNTA